jgi:hypothetical protein
MILAANGTQTLAVLAMALGLGALSFGAAAGPNDPVPMNGADFTPRVIAATGYKGYVGQEFIPTRDPMQSLREAVRLCDV